MHRSHTVSFLVSVLVLALFSAVYGCKPGQDNMGEKKGAIESTVMTVAKITEKKPKLPPEAEEFVERVFAGMELDVSASAADEIRLGPEGGLDAGNKMVLDDALFKVNVKGGHVTEINGESALIDPQSKSVVFENGAKVTGPWDNVLECGRLTWHYTRDVLEAEEGFNIMNGHGITNGERCRTDVAFKSISIE